MLPYYSVIPHRHDLYFVPPGVPATHDSHFVAPGVPAPHNPHFVAPGVPAPHNSQFVAPGVPAPHHSHFVAPGVPGMLPMVQMPSYMPITYTPPQTNHIGRRVGSGMPQQHPTNLSAPQIYTDDSSWVQSVHYENNGTTQTYPSAPTELPLESPRSSQLEFVTQPQVVAQNESTISASTAAQVPQEYCMIEAQPPRFPLEQPQPGAPGSTLSGLEIPLQQMHVGGSVLNGCMVDTQLPTFPLEQPQPGAPESTRSRLETPLQQMRFGRLMSQEYCMAEAHPPTPPAPLQYGAPASTQSGTFCGTEIPLQQIHCERSPSKGYCTAETQPPRLPFEQSQPGAPGSTHSRLETPLQQMRFGRLVPQEYCMDEAHPPTLPPAPSQYGAPANTQSGTFHGTQIPLQQIHCGRSPSKGYCTAETQPPRLPLEQPQPGAPGSTHSGLEIPLQPMQVGGSVLKGCMADTQLPTLPPAQPQPGAPGSTNSRLEIPLQQIQVGGSVSKRCMAEGQPPTLPLAQPQPEIPGSTYSELEIALQQIQVPKRCMAEGQPPTLPLAQPQPETPGSTYAELAIALQQIQVPKRCMAEGQPPTLPLAQPGTPGSTHSQLEIALQQMQVGGSVSKRCMAEGQPPTLPLAQPQPEIPGSTHSGLEIPLQQIQIGGSVLKRCRVEAQPPLCLELPQSRGPAATQSETFRGAEIPLQQIRYGGSASKVYYTAETQPTQPPRLLSHQLQLRTPAGIQFWQQKGAQSVENRSEIRAVASSAGTTLQTPNPLESDMKRAHKLLDIPFPTPGTQPPILPKPLTDSSNSPNFTAKISNGAVPQGQMTSNVSLPLARDCNSSLTPTSATQGADNIQQREPNVQQPHDVGTSGETQTQGEVGGNDGIQSSSSSTHSVTATPVDGTKEWHKSIKNNLRNLMVKKVVDEILPAQITTDERFNNVLSYVQKVELHIFQTANSLSEYYHLLAETMYRIMEISLPRSRRYKQSLQKQLEQHLAAIGAMTCREVTDGPNAVRERNSLGMLVLNSTPMANTNANLFSFQQPNFPNRFLMGDFGRQQPYNSITKPPPHFFPGGLNLEIPSFHGFPYGLCKQINPPSRMKIVQTAVECASANPPTELGISPGTSSTAARRDTHTQSNSNEASSNSNIQPLKVQSIATENSGASLPSTYETKDKLNSIILTNDLIEVKETEKSNPPDDGKGIQTEVKNKNKPELVTDPRNEEFQTNSEASSSSGSYIDMDSVSTTPSREEIDMDLIEDLRCSLCKCYLSCGPLQILRNGYTICGRCTASTVEGPISRNMTAECALKKTTFPCCFMERGCVFTALFDRIAEHEALCEHRNYQCPIDLISSVSCRWNGPMFKLSQHLHEAHNYNLEDFEAHENIVELDVTERQVLVGGVLQYKGMLKIHFETMLYYCADKKELHCIISYHPKYDKIESFCKINVFNGYDSDCFVSLKEKCFQINCNAGKPATQHVKLDMKPYIEILENPDLLKVSVCVRFNVL